MIDNILELQLRRMSVDWWTVMARTLDIGTRADYNRLFQTFLDLEMLDLKYVDDKEDILTYMRDNRRVLEDKGCYDYEWAQEFLNREVERIERMASAMRKINDSFAAIDRQSTVIGRMPGNNILSLREIANGFL